MKGKSKMKRTVSCFVVLAVLAIVPSVLRADVLNVPEAYATVEAALAAAVKGDTVRVAPGEYMLADYAGITVPSGVTLEGTGNSPEDTVFKAYSATASDTTLSSLVHVTNGVLCNLTFKGARCNTSGSVTNRALHASYGARVSDCVFTDNIQYNTVAHNATLIGEVVLVEGEETKVEKTIFRNTEVSQNVQSKYARFHIMVTHGAEMSECIVTNNQTRLNTGGIVQLGNNAKLLNTVISKNKLLKCEVTIGSSCGVRVAGAGAVIEDCLIEKNASEGITSGEPSRHLQAGGIYMATAGTVKRTIVRNNSTMGGNVGGVWVAAGAATIENCLIDGNFVTALNTASGSNVYNKYFYAGGLRIDTANTKVMNCTIVNNYISETDTTKSVCVHGAWFKGKATCVNSIFYGNGRDDCIVANPNVYNNGGATISHSLTGDEKAGFIVADPLFVDSENGNYKLNEKSPCRNAGTSTVSGVPDNDLEGIVRPQESIHDIGCYEFVYADERVVEFTQSTDFVGPKGNEVVFEAFPNHIDDVLSHTWKIVDGDGNVIVEETVTGSNEWKYNFAHKYTTFTVTLTTAWTGGKTVQCTSKIQGALAETYVSSSGNNIAPYDSWENAAHNIADAIDAVYGADKDAPGSVYLAPGVYTSSSGGSSDGAYLVSIAKSVRLVGTGETPEETVLDGEGTRRVLSLTGAGAGAENLVIARARTSSTSTTGTNFGYALNMVNAGIVDNCVISNAVTTGAVEGCVEHWVYLNGGVITNSVIRDGNAGTAGRCVWVNKGSIGSSAIFGCVSRHKHAGVITVDGTASSLVDCDVYNNQDQMREFGYRCGTVAAGSGAKILNCRIFNNETTFNRSAHYLGIGINAASYYTNTSWKEDYGNVLIDGCVISNNTTSVGDVPNSSTKAAACGVLLGYKTVLRNSLIVNNSISQKNNAVYDYPVAGGVRTADSASYSAGASVENCTIASNTSCVHQAAGGVYLLAGSIVNSISYGNGGQRKGQSWIDGDLLLSGNATAAYTLTKEEVAGEGNIAADPLLNDDYTFGRRSPALNAGIRQEWMKGALDLSGKARVYGDRVDLGCFELEIMQGFRVIVR